MTAAWPTLAELKQRIDVTSDDFDGEAHLEGARQAAIAQVKTDVGDWDEIADVPDYSLSQAALLLATRIAKAPGEAPSTLTNDNDYGRLLKGHHRRFGIG